MTSAAAAARWTAEASSNKRENLHLTIYRILFLPNLFFGASKPSTPSVS